MPSAVRPGHFTRVSMNMQTNLLLNNIRTNSVDLLKAQDRISSGLRIGRPSDSPSEATTVMHLDNTLERFDQFIKNMDFANDMLATADNALGQAVNLVTDALALALEDTSDAGLVANATIIDSILDQLVTVANTSARGNYIFAGQNGTTEPFSTSTNGIMYNGSIDEMLTRVSLDNSVNFSVDGNDVFGGMSGEVVGIADLNPNITEAMLLSDLNGAQGEGIRLSSIRISDGVNPNVVIDLSSAVTVGDVINKINAEAPAGTTAAISVDGTSLTISSGVGGADLTISEVGTGYTASDLGIVAASAGASVLGQDVDARLSLATPVTALAGGAGIDTTNGLLITNSAISGTGPVDLSGAQTLQDILNRINTAGLAVRAVINESGNGINVYNQLSGSELRIGENGGTTATDLGIRSLVGTTALADLNGDDGVHVVGQDNLPGVIRITDKNAVAYDVDLSSATTFLDVVNLINTATGGVDVVASLAVSGNGLLLTDNTGGGAAFSVTTISTNGFDVAAELGFDSGNTSTAGATLTGTDVNPAMPAGVFSHLIALRDAMNAGDRTAIRNVAAKLKEDETRLIKFHGQVGAQMRALEDRQSRLEDNSIAMETLRSDLRDIDFAEAVTRYENIYTALQANLMSASQITNTSLLDFLR